MITGKTYDFLKWVALILLPAIGSAYFALAGIWDLPNAEQVVGTIVVIDTFLGALLGISIKRWNASDEKYAGDIKIVTGADNDSLVVGFDDPTALVDKDEVLLKVLKEAG